MGTVELLLKFVTAAGALFAAMWAIYEWRRSQRWKKAVLAKEIHDKIFNDPLSVNALGMIDWEKLNISAADQKKYNLSTNEINSEMIRNALKTKPKDHQYSPEEKFIRVCFGKLYDNLEHLQHYIDIDLVDYDDVSYPFAWYARSVHEGWEFHGQYLEFCDYPKTIRLIKRLADEIVV